MNTDKLNSWLSLLANFGVVVGLGLLVIEIRQNSELMRAQIHSMRAEAKTDRQMELANSGEVIRIMQTVFSAGFPVDSKSLEVLTPEDRMRLSLFLTGLKEAIGNWHFQCQQGLLDDELCQTSYRATVIGVTPWLRAANVGLEDMRPSFVADVRRITQEQGLPVPGEDGSW